MLGIGLIGCGRIGKVHARSIAQLGTARIIAVADAVQESAEALAASSAAEVRDAATLIASADLDAVVIGSPTDTHFDLIDAATKAGKAIFCEKPVDMSSDRIRACIEKVNLAEVPFLTAFNRRFDPNFAHLQSRIKAGDIGQIEIVTILSRDPSPPPIGYIKSSGGLFRDMMIHDFDMARFLLGEDPVRIYAAGASLVDPEIGIAGDIDSAAVTMTTATGKICQISNSRRATYGYDQRIEVHGSKGMLRAENVLENTVEFASAQGFSRPTAQHFFLERYEAAYRKEMEHFIASVTNRTPISPNIEDGLKAQLLADAAALSLETGNAVRLD